MLLETSEWITKNCKFAAWDSYNESGQNRFWGIHQVRELVDEVRKRSRASNPSLAKALSQRIRQYFSRLYKDELQFYRNESGVDVRTPLDLKKAKDKIRESFVSSVETETADVGGCRREPLWPKLPMYALPESPDTSPGVIEKYLDFHFPRKSKPK